MPKKLKFGGGNKCMVCKKTVFHNEQIAYEGKFVHENCFKCSICNKKMSVNTCGSMDGYEPPSLVRVVVCLAMVLYACETVLNLCDASGYDAAIS